MCECSACTICQWACEFTLTDMQNRDQGTGQYQHDWGFMANGGTNKKGDLLQCQHAGCEVWSYMGEKPYFKMTHDQFVAMHESGEINATEVLGVRKSAV